MEWVDGIDFLELAIQEGIDHIVFTANSVIGRNGLVMGAGAALRIREAYPGIDTDFARVLNRMPPGDYHVVQVNRPEAPSHVYALQVKRHYKHPGDLELCKSSLLKLTTMLESTRAVMNCPLILNGGFADQKSVVYDMVEDLLKNSNVLVTRFN